LVRRAVLVRSAEPLRDAALRRPAARSRQEVACAREGGVVCSAPLDPRRRSPMRPCLSRVVLALVAAFLLVGLASPVTAAPGGPGAGGVHLRGASPGRAPAETEGIITPFMVLYGLHDALVKPMPAGINTPSLAESFTQSKDGLTYEFVIRKGVKFHNGDPVTAADVKFSFERYKGAVVKLLKQR